MTRLTDGRRLSRGAHPTRDDGLCTMELVAWLAGEAHTDEPRCTSPVLIAAVRTINDRIPDALRDPLLRPLAPRLVGTRADARVDAARAAHALDVAVTVLAPRILCRRGRSADAAALSALPRRRGAQSLCEAVAATGIVLPRSVGWMLARANDGTAPTEWVKALAFVAEASGDDGAWRVAVDATTAMAAMAAARAPRRLRRDQNVNSNRISATQTSS
jgi:hypothetical protein